MMYDRKPGFITYLYSALVALLFAVLLFVFSNLVDTESSIVPFVLLTVYDIVNVILVRKFKPSYCFAPFAVSVITFFLLYKVVGVSSVISMYNADGFLSDGEFAHSYGLDILMVSMVISTYIFSVFIRFVLSKQKLRKVSKSSVRKFFAYLCVIVLVGVSSILSWKIAEPYKDAYLKHVSTFSTDKWIAYPDSRVTMFEDFESNNSLTGMTKDEIIRLFGDPDSSDKSEIVYKLGDSEKGHHKLVIELENDIVLSYNVDIEIFMADVVEKVQNKQK